MDENKFKVFMYYKWACRYVPMIGYVASYIHNPKAADMIAPTKSALQRKIRNHYHNWGW